MRADHEPPCGSVTVRGAEWHNMRNGPLIFDTRWVGAHGIGRFAAELFQRLPEFSPIEMRGRPTSPIDPLVLAAHLRRRRPALFLSPGYNAPYRAAGPFAFCVHDLNHYAPTTPFAALKQTYFTALVRPAVRKAHIVFTVSEFSRRLICEWAQVDDKRVVNVGNGVSVPFVAEGTVVTHYSRPYFLHTGGCRAHKNLRRLLLACSQSEILKETLLVCLGTPSREIAALLRELNLQHRVAFIGTVPDGELAALYRGAIGLVFVSLQEGFGLPIVEAMACGCPVITSDASSMPEVAGTAAILVDPYDVPAIRASMERLTQDLPLREAMRLRGLERAQSFRWEDTAGRVRAALVAFLA
jgi:glycosyltransferase involved in cell wall biosynthesis